MDKAQVLSNASDLSNRAIESYAQTNYPQAESLFAQALDLRKAALGPGALEVARDMYNLASVYYVQARYREAGKLYRGILKIQEKHLGPQHPALAQSLHWLAEVCFADRHYARAGQAYRRAISILEAQTDPDSPELAAELTAYGFLEYYIGEHAEAEQLFLRALDIRERVLGPDHTDVAEVTWHLARTYENCAELGKSPETCLRRTLDILSKAAGPESPDAGEAACRLASWLADVGQYEEADQRFAEWRRVYEQLPDDKAQEWSWMRSCYLEYLRSRGRRGEAEAFESLRPEADAYEQWLTDELRHHEATLGSEHLSVAESLLKLCHASVFEGNTEQADNQAQRAMDIARTHFAQDDPEMIPYLWALAKVRSSQERYGEAQELLQRSLDLQKKLTGTQHPDYADLLQRLGSVISAQGRFDDAKSLYEESVAIRERLGGLRNYDGAEALWHLGRFYAAHNKLDDALPVFERLTEVSKGRMGVSELEKADYYRGYAWVLEQVGRSDEAAEWTRKAKRIEKQHGYDSDSE